MPNDPQYWISIPGGPFPRRDEQAFQSLATRNANLPAFRIAKFAVTGWEYDQFLCANDGREQPSGWDEQIQHPSRPVTGVSWDNAQHSCRWSGAQLPTDEQWEFAARGALGRIFPWGSQKQAPDADNPPVAVAKAYDFVLWLVQKIENFPKSHRFMIGERLAANGLDLLTLLVEASYTRQKSELLEAASRKVNAVRMLLRLAKDLKLMSMEAYAFSAEQLDEVGGMVGSWSKTAVAAT